MCAACCGCWLPNSQSPEEHIRTDYTFKKYLILQEILHEVIVIYETKCALMILQCMLDVTI